VAGAALMRVATVEDDTLTLLLRCAPANGVTNAVAADVKRARNAKAEKRAMMLRDCVKVGGRARNATRACNFSRGPTDFRPKKKMVPWGHGDSFRATWISNTRLRSSPQADKIAGSGSGNNEPESAV